LQKTFAKAKIEFEGDSQAKEGEYEDDSQKQRGFEFGGDFWE